MERRYFILDRVAFNELTALESCIGQNYTQRYSLDGSQVLIKTNSDIINEYLNNNVECLGAEYSEKEIRVIMRSDKWDEGLETLETGTRISLENDTWQTI